MTALKGFNLMCARADIEDIIRKKAVPIGNGAHVTCPKEYIGRTVYLVVCTE